MASIVLSAVGSFAGAEIGGSAIAATIGAQIGAAIGGQIDQALFSQSIHREGARLEDLAVQSSSYGGSIPIVYGSARLGGNIIWSRPLKEVATTTETGGKGGGGTSSTTNYSYYASFAVAICEGEIDKVERIWADTFQLDLSQGTYRIYKGTEDQLPDPLIQSFEQVHLTPAYRGLAYLVVEDFPLEAFGNRIPNFTFEVTRKLLPSEINDEPLEHHIKSMVMIPGSGEFVYDDIIHYKQNGQEVAGAFIESGYREPVNLHNNQGIANALVSIDQMLDTCPNLEWVAVVVTWFGDDLDAGNCTIKPAVEFQGSAQTTPSEWGVATYTRDTAPLMTFVNGVPRYGGTPSDASIVRYIDELKSRGLKVMLIPMFFMDVADKPWRGRVTGSIADVSDFFTKTDGYNDFIIHYANLTKNKVDAFIIGSELVGLTKVNDGASVNRNFPAVDALVNLAAYIKGVMGGGTKLTYAADWSEYHHTEDGWYHLDPLWASPNIDFVGIDAYFPLTDKPSASISLQDAIDGWSSGEGWSFYYTDPERTMTAPLSQEYAWKNIDWWWNNTHTNPDGNSTAWVGQSKKIWFTEYGFPSVDGATNQPNVFYDPSSSESFFPRFSQGRIDNLSQRLGLLATELQWQNSTMVEEKFIWTWDARPYPYWPDLRSVWADGELWKTGHWVNGKLGVSGLAAIVKDLCLRSGLSESHIDVSRLEGTVDGYLLLKQKSIREALESLMGAYFFDCVESDGQLSFVPRGGESQLDLPQDNLLPNDIQDKRSLVSVARMQEVDLPQQVSVIYLNQASNFQTGHQIAQRAEVESKERATLNFPIIMGQGQAQQIAEISLHTAWTGRTQFEFELPPSAMALEPCDIVTLQMDNNVNHTVRITQMMLGEGYYLRVRGVLEDLTTYDTYHQADEADEPVLPNAIADTSLKLLDIPLLPGDAVTQNPLRVAMNSNSESWRGAVLYRSPDDEQTWNAALSVQEGAVCGALVEIPESDIDYAFQDNRSEIIVNILGDGTLASTTQTALLNGANAALVGDEILQFATAELMGENQYKLSGLLRGRLGTECAMDSHEPGERFVLLNENTPQDANSASLIGLARHYRAVSIGQTLGQVSSTTFTHTGIGVKPYAPVHIRGTRDGSGNLEMSWIRRSRTEINWRDLVDVPLNEDSEAYEIDVMDGANVVRTLTSSVPSATYTAIQQVADFGATQPSIMFRIYQLSAAIGRGFKSEITL